MMKVASFVGVFIQVAWVSMTTSFSCLSPSGSPVDWYFVYKIPELRDDPNPLVRQGSAHFYMDINRPTWTLSNISISERGHAIYYTLEQLYDQSRNEESAYALYNDQLPNKTWTERYGHIKGLFGFEKSGGFWLTHTVPHFPPSISDGYYYPHSGHLYGQTAMCISLDYKYLDALGVLMRYNYPWVYDYYLPSSFRPDAPNLESYLRSPGRAHIRKPPWYHVAEMTSTFGTHFVAFAKFTEFNADIYGALISQTFSESFYSETWQNNEENLPSNCSGPYKVYNVQHISLPNQIDFDNDRDHSKWAVSTASSPLPIVCMCDNNRQVHQLIRGGGAICLHNKAVWYQFQSSVSDYSDCDQDPK